MAYSGVHQVFQLALAAEQLGALDRFFCSAFDAPGKWGRWMSRALGRDALTNRRCTAIPGAKVTEYPWPLLAQRLKRKLHPAQPTDWLQINAWFDRWVADQLGSVTSSVFLGVETCAEFSLATARGLGMKTILDWPGVGTEFLDRIARRAAIDLGMPAPETSDLPEMSKRKARELELADLIQVCSDLQQRLLVQQGIAPEKICVVPLWADPDLWFPAPEPLANHGPLRVIFAGKINLRKGVPYLLQALDRVRSRCELVLVGPVATDGAPALEQFSGRFRWLPPQTKTLLRNLFWRHDVLVLPSLGDSFGFVAMEAMACGLPVIVTENCGVPVPDPAWRVPIMDSVSIARKLDEYAGDRDKLAKDGRVAQLFARQFSPERYRDQVKCLFRGLLRETTQPQPI